MSTTTTRSKRTRTTKGRENKSRILDSGKRGRILKVGDPVLTPDVVRCLESRRAIDDLAEALSQVSSPLDVVFMLYVTRVVLALADRKRHDRNKRKGKR